METLSESNTANDGTYGQEKEQKCQDQAEENASAECLPTADLKARQMG